jgi:hypothetical protein
MNNPSQNLWKIVVAGRYRRTPKGTLATSELVFGVDTGWCWLTPGDTSRGAGAR